MVYNLKKNMLNGKELCKLNGEVEHNLNTKKWKQGVYIIKTKDLSKKIIKL